MVTIIGTIAALILGFAFAYYFGNKLATNKINEAEEKAKNYLDTATKQANAMQKEKLLEIKEEFSKKKIEFESEIQSKRSKIQQTENQLKQRAEVIQKKEHAILEAEAEIKKYEEKIKEKNEEIANLVKGQRLKLEKISQLSKEEAKKQLIESLKNEAKIEAAKSINAIREEAKLTATQESQNIILTAIQRAATDTCIENTVSVVTLDNDEMKGRIIGREGRNIRSFESATGVDLIIDDTPEAVVISGYDPLRREVAKRSLEKLMLDGRIHPSRIEEVVNKTKKELEESIFKEGENIILEMGINNMHTELIKFIGRMRYRTSYGQNLLNHSIEVAYIAGIIATELKLDIKLARRAAILHDIGKCVDKEVEGPHALIGMELAKKYKENAIVINAIGAHHEDIESESLYSVIVQVADSISGARPGARRESVENYIKRLEKLENIGDSFEGVNKTFAIQAGREIRVIVNPEAVDDTRSFEIAHEIKDKIEATLQYPGTIKVTVIRETRATEVAK